MARSAFVIVGEIPASMAAPSAEVTEAALAVGSVIRSSVSTMTLLSEIGSEKNPLGCGLPPSKM